MYSKALLTEYDAEHMTWIDWSIVGLYVVSAIAIGAWFTRKASKGTTDFFVAGRSLGWFVAGTSIGAVVGACYLAGKLKEFEEWACSLNRKRILSYLDLRVRSAGLIGGRKLNLLLEENFGLKMGLVFPAANCDLPVPSVHGDRNYFIAEVFKCRRD